MNKEHEERALELHKKSIIIDGLEYAPGIGDIKYFDDLIEAGVTAGNMTVTATYDTPSEAMKKLKSWYDLFEEHSDKVIQVNTARDIERAKREGKFGVIMGTQNCDILGGDLSLLPVYKRLGLRIFQLNYYWLNLLGEGCGERTDGGLSVFGIKVVEELNRLGLVVDASHCAPQVTTDAINYSKGPIIITHANPRGLIEHIRNKTDEQIKALADKGGVMGMVAWSRMCEVRKGVRPTFEDFLDMVDYMVKLVGPNHVSLGLDLTPGQPQKDYEYWAQLYPALKSKGGFFERCIFTNKEGIDDVSQMSEITKGLVARGYSDQDIEKILGLNFLRVFREICGE